MCTATSAAQAFEHYALDLERETARLKAVNNIKQVVAGGGPESQDVSLRLKDIEKCAKEIETMIFKFEDALDEDLEAIEEIKNVLEVSNQNSSALDALINRTPPKMLPQEKNSFPTLEEFNAVPKATRMRISKEAIDKALADIRKLVTMKSKLVSSPRDKLSHSLKLDLDAYLSMKTEEHGDSVFFVESEMKHGTTSIFESGDSTGRAILSTLRALKRLKVVKSGKDITYILAQDL